MIVETVESRAAAVMASFILFLLPLNEVCNNEKVTVLSMESGGFFLQKKYNQFLFLVKQKKRSISMGILSIMMSDNQSNNVCL